MTPIVYLDPRIDKIPSIDCVQHELDLIMKHYGQKVSKKSVS